MLLLLPVLQDFVKSAAASRSAINLVSKMILQPTKAKATTIKKGPRL